MATRRPDLEALPYKNPGFIADFLFPRLIKAVKGGTVYYQDILADVGVTTNRSLGKAPAATLISSSSTTYTLAEKIARMKMDKSEVEQLGGLDIAQQKAARKGKRSVGSAIETLAMSATFGDATIQHRDILTSFLTNLSVAKETVLDYADGKIALFGCRRMIDRLKRLSEITGKMTYTGMINRDDVRDVRNISDDILAGAIGVDMVLAGPTSEWLGTTTHDGKLGLVVLPDNGIDPDEAIQFGRTAVMNVEGGTDIFECSSYYSDDLKSEVVDTVAWVNLIALNKECCYILTGLDESNAVTTTV